MNPLDTFCQTASDAELKERLRDCVELYGHGDAEVWAYAIHSELHARANVRRVHASYIPRERPVLGACY